MEEADAMPEDPEELKSALLSEDGHVSDLMAAAESEELLDTSTTIEYFECPECGELIPDDATKCPKCGVEFEVEEVFECPMCKTLVDIHVNKCPNCGAEFVDETGAAEPPKKEAPEEPVEPSSFADRLKSMKEKEVPATSKKTVADKPMTFAERMKALKEGDVPEKPREGPKPEPRPAPSKPAAGPPAKAGKAPAPKPAPRPVPARASAADKYSELPKLITEVKKLLALAKENNIDISNSKALINKAVAAGKQRDLGMAVKLVKEGKLNLSKDLRATQMVKLKTLNSAVSLGRKAGKDVSTLDRLLGDIQKAINGGDYLAAATDLKRAQELVDGISAATLPKAELGSLEQTIKDALSLHVNVSEARNMLEQAKKASASNDTEKVTKLAKDINDSLMKVLPAYIASEMRKAKISLREVKMMNVDISKPVDILKQANNSVRDGDYGEALHSIKQFKDFMTKAQG